MEKRKRKSASLLRRKFNIVIKFYYFSFDLKFYCILCKPICFVRYFEVILLKPQLMRGTGYGAKEMSRDQDSSSIILCTPV